MFYLFLMIVLLSCSNEKNDVQKLSRIPHTDSTFQNDSSVAEVEIDLLSPEECFSMETISESEYKRLYSKFHNGNTVLLSEMNLKTQFFSLDGLSNIKKAFWDMEEPSLRGSNIIKRNKDELYIEGQIIDTKFENKYNNFYPEHLDSLENNYTIEKFFIYDGKLSKSEINCIEALYYEGSSYFLADKFGFVIEVTGKPIEAPDGRHLFCTNTDLVAGFSSNGFGIIVLDERGNASKLCEVLPEDYGLNSAVWISDSEIAAEKETIDENMESTYTFVKITLKENK